MVIRAIQSGIVGGMIGLILFVIIPLLRNLYTKKWTKKQICANNNISKRIECSIGLAGISVFICAALYSVTLAATILSSNYVKDYIEINTTNMVTLSDETQKYLSYDDSSIIYRTKTDNDEILVNKISYTDCKIIPDNKNYVIKKQEFRTMEKPLNGFIIWFLDKDISYGKASAVENYQYEIHISNTDMIIK